MVEKSVKHFYDVIVSRYFERGDYVATGELYAEYTLFCELNSYKPVRHQVLSQSWQLIDDKITSKKLSVNGFHKEEN